MKHSLVIHATSVLTRDICEPPCRYREIAFAQMEGDSKNALLANSQLEEELHMQVRVHIIFSVAETVH